MKTAQTGKLKLVEIVLLLALAAGLSQEQVGLITEENQGYVLKSKLLEFWGEVQTALDRG